MTPILIVILVCIAVVGILVYFAYRFHRIATLIKDTPTSKVIDLHERLVEVQGSVRAGGRMLQSPLAGTDCVYYRFKVEERRTSGMGNHHRSHWRTIINDSEVVPCLVEDDTGVAEVMLEEAKLVLAPDSHTHSGFFNDTSPELERTLNDRYGRSSKGFIFNKSMRYSETILEVGDPLYVLGTVTAISDGPPRIAKADGPVFLVSDKPESKLQSRYTWFAVLCILGAIAVIVGGAWWIGLRFS